MENTHNILLPPKNLIGVGALKDLPNELLKYKLNKVLIVTDKNLVAYGYVEMVATILRNLFISYDIFDGVQHPNCTVGFVEDGMAFLNKETNLLKRDYNLLISIGGGTNHDCAKGISILATNGGKIQDYEGYCKIPKPCLPVISINTTSGSASEVTSFSIVTDENRKVKMAIADPKILPIISVNDPLFMTTMPPEVTASSGIDVVSHSIEAYVSTEASPITDALALDAIKIVFRYLKRAYDNGHDTEAREQMMFASTMAGMAFNNAGLGYVHAMAHQVGGFYNQIHGACNAVLLPYVLEFNSPGIPKERILKICEAVGEKAEDQQEAIDKIKNKIQTLSKDISIAINLSALGLLENDIPTLSENALKDITTMTNPRQGTLTDIMNIFKAAF